MLENYYVIAKKIDSKEDFKFYKESERCYMRVSSDSKTFTKDRTDELLLELKIKGYEAHLVNGSIDFMDTITMKDLEKLVVNVKNENG